VLIILKVNKQNTQRKEPKEALMMSITLRGLFAKAIG